MSLSLMRATGIAETAARELRLGEPEDPICAWPNRAGDGHRPRWNSSPTMIASTGPPCGRCYRAAGAEVAGHAAAGGRLGTVGLFFFM